MKRVLLSTVVGATVLFVWGAVSHLALPWYDPAFSRFRDEGAVTTALTVNATTPGIYYVPFDAASRGPGVLEAFVNVRPYGPPRTAAAQIGLAFLLNAFGAVLAFALCGTPPASGRRHVIRYSILGLLLGAVPYGYLWVWFAFPDTYVVISILDAWIAWSLVGLSTAPLSRFA